MHPDSPDYGRLMFSGIVGAVRAIVTSPNGRMILFACAAVLIVKLLARWMERRRLAAAGMDEVDRMSGLDFEKFVEALFRRLGYSVERTQYVGDYGADLVIVKDGVRTAVQAKRWNRKVGVKAVQEIVAAKGKYRCAEAMVVTNGAYTQQAVELARANGVRLWDRADVVAARLATRREAAEASPASAASGPQACGAVCAACGCLVSEKVARYCADHADRFAGQVLCYACQRHRVRAA